MALLGAVALVGCSSSEPGASADAITRAERLYTRCVEDELGIELERLHIGRDGDIDVEFGAGTTREDAERARRVCEPRIGSVLEPGGISVLGPPPNLGRLGTDGDLDALLRERAALGFEGALAVDFRGEPRLRAGFGEITLGSSRTPDGETAFDCGSIMKDVTSSLVLLLERDGALSRAQALGDFFPSAPQVWRTVTIQQVLEHSAGFDTYHDTEGDFEEMDRAAALERIFAQEPLFPPGSDVEYSNSGYTLLAALLELASGEPYVELARLRVFEPAGMSRSGVYGEPLWPDRNVAVGRGADTYGDNDPARWPAPSWALMGNGGLVSTVDDLLRFTRWFSREIVPPLLEERPEAVAEAPALGGRPVLALAGGNDFGFNALIGHVIGDDTFVVAASHVLSPVSAEILGVELLQVLYGEALEGVAE